MLFVRFGPKASLHGMPAPHAAGGEVAAARGDRDPRLGAVVDPPAEVVERRRDDGDREDVLHRGRHHVLAPRDAGLVGHEARVDQPHQDDGEEVELLAEDRAVAGELLGRRRLGCLREDRLPASALSSRSTRASLEARARGGLYPRTIRTGNVRTGHRLPRCVMWRADTTPAKRGMAVSLDVPRRGRRADARAGRRRGAPRWAARSAPRWPRWRRGSPGSTTRSRSARRAARARRCGSREADLDRVRAGARGAAAAGATTRRARPRLRDASSAAAEPPLAIAEAAAEVAELARAAGARRGRPALRGDALAGADLAAGAARAAARLVEINLADAPGDARVERARAAVARASG